MAATVRPPRLRLRALLLVALAAVVADGREAGCGEAPRAHVASNDPPLCRRATLPRDGTPGTRPYLQLRVGRNGYARPNASSLALQNPAAEPPAGLAVGADFGRHVSAEVAVDISETALRFLGDERKLGELSTWSVLAQARYRHPVAQGRLVPYALVGAGFAASQANDAVLGRLKDTSAVSWSPLFAMGVGLEYFVADNLALGFEARRTFLGSADVATALGSHRVDLDAWLLQAGARFYFDRRPPSGARVARNLGIPAADTCRLRGYLGLRAGAALFPWTEGDGRMRLDGRFSETGGVVLGMNVSRHLGFEIASEYAEPSVVEAPRGHRAEYSLWTILAQARLRAPLRGGRLVPYGLVGGGVGFGEINDLREDGAGPSTDRGTFPVACVGAGVEWFVSQNLAVGIEAKQVFPFTADLRFDDATEEFRLAPLVVTAGLRFLFP